VLILAKRIWPLLTVLISMPAFSLPVPDATKDHAAHATGKISAEAVAPIVWRGDQCSARLFKDLAERFNASGQGKVIVEPFSTISGLDAVHSGSADVAGSARSAMPGREEELSTKFHPIAWDALVPIVSIDNPVNNISLKQLHDLYLGRITNWSQLGGADAPINLYAVAAPLDGVEYSTRQLLFYYGDQAISAPRLYINTVQLEAGVVIDPHGIGMSTLSGVAGNHKLKMLSVEGVAATDASIADGNYPLYTALYLASRIDDPKHEQVSRLIAFVNSDAGKAIMLKHDLVPYADAPGLVGMQDQRVAFINARIRPIATTTAESEPVAPVSAPSAEAWRVASTSRLSTEVKARAARTKEAKREEKKADAEAVPSPAIDGH
ncbi:MAG TPA: substrate-binding domain-containing protein, partial [Rudaea sp.]|nr:substrate-binding domain-containing protein [Rudaea sp.]